MPPFFLEPSLRLHLIWSFHKTSHPAEKRRMGHPVFFLGVLA
jgi:hypothetical protein